MWLYLNVIYLGHIMEHVYNNTFHWFMIFKFKSLCIHPAEELSRSCKLLD